MEAGGVPCPKVLTSTETETELQPYLKALITLINSPTSNTIITLVNKLFFPKAGPEEKEKDNEMKNKNKKKKKRDTDQHYPLTSLLASPHPQPQFLFSAFNCLLYHFPHLSSFRHIFPLPTILEFKWLILCSAYLFPSVFEAFQLGAVRSSGDIVFFFPLFLFHSILLQNIFLYCFRPQSI